MPTLSGGKDATRSAAGRRAGEPREVVSKNGSGPPRGLETFAGKPGGKGGASAGFAALRAWLRGARSGREVAFDRAVVVGVVLLAFGLRAFRIGASWDLGEDELDYLQISHGVLRTMWVVGWDGGPFYLHPPLFFFLEAVHIRLFGIGGDLILQIYGVRYMNAAFGALSAGALLWIGHRVAGWPAGLAASALFALDPFAVKMNSRNFLEVPTVFFVLLGYGTLFSALARGGRVSWRRAVLAGVFFGLALLTKDKSAFVTLVPLGVCFLLGWSLPRAKNFLVGAVALVVYSPYLAIVYAIGDWGTFVDQKGAGVLRLAGLMQVTGFNQADGPSFLGAIIHRLDEFATTYAFLATGALAVCVLLSLDLGDAPARRLLAAWTASAYAFLCYSVVFGTLEEHFFYYLLVASILATAVAATLVLGRVRELDADGHYWRRTRRTLQAGTAVFVAALLVWSAYVWGVVHLVPDNGYERVAYHLGQLPEGGRVAVTSGVAETVIKGYEGDGAYTSVGEIKKADIDYVLMSSYLSEEGWGQPPPAVYRWVEQKGRLVYGFTGRSHGLLGIWLLDNSPHAASPKGHDAPPGDEPGPGEDAACEAHDRVCIRGLVEEISPGAEYVGGRVETGVEGPVAVSNVLYFEDPNLAPCRYRRLEGISNGRARYVAVVAGEGSYEREGDGCVPDLD